MERTLGVLWDPLKDTFEVTSVTKEVKETKQVILPFISFIFGHLDMVNQAILEPKQILQKLWERKVNLDDIIPQGLSDTWTKWKESLPYLDQIEIQRWYGYNDQNINNIELHIFISTYLSGASSIAYVAFFYMQIESKGNVRCCFITGKSLLAPNK